ncbi:trypsin-like serine protease, partial [bacterium]|nr:trypsin-like serine protease [bacterium]
MRMIREEKTTTRWLGGKLMMVLACIAVVSSSLAQENLTALIKKVSPSVVLVITYDEEGEELSGGSGFFISEAGDVITNRHVIQGAYHAEVKTADEKVYDVKKILAEDKEGDLIRLSVDIPRDAVHVLGISDSLPEVGERVIVVGNPLGLEQTVSDGIVSAVREIPAFGNIIQITAPISSGSSGSPVVNMKGEVIGVASFQMVEGQNLNFAIPGERVTKLTPIKKPTLSEWTQEKIEKTL